jgi:hypothetical protein
MNARTLLPLAIALAPTLLNATNPKILIKDPPSSATPVTSNTFTFGANAQGGGIFSFQNASGTDWTSMLVTATLPNLTAITCGPGPFVTCTVSETQVSKGWLYDILFGPTTTGAGINNGMVFEVILNDEGTDPNGAGSWPASVDFSAKTNVTPEPASVLLLISGGLVIGVLRRRRIADRA